MASRHSRVFVGGCLSALLGLAGCQPTPPEPLTVLPADLPNGVQTSSYSVTLTADGKAPWKWRILAGALPAGLELDGKTGVLSGTPQAGGDFTFTVSVEDNGFVSRRGEAQYTLTIIPRLTINSTLPNARELVPYDRTFPVNGGIAPYSFELIGLPAGLTFDEQTGRIQGTPPLGSARSGIQMSLLVSDSGNPQQSIQRTVTLTVKPQAVQIATGQDDVPIAHVNANYQLQLTATNGATPYHWAIIDGALPPGSGGTVPRLNQDTGLISGKPTVAGEFTFTVEVTDADSPPTTATRSFTIEVQP